MQRFSRLRVSNAGSNTIASALGILLGATLIAQAARGDLWIDEIWSIAFARTTSSGWSLITRLQHDNNHLLNTFFLRWLGEQSNLYAYRTLAVASGLIALVLLALIAGRWGRLVQLYVVYLASTSSLLVRYFSEARGYAPAMAFGVAAFAILHRGRHHLRPFPIAAFWTVVGLGLLAHLTFLFVLVALLIASLGYEGGRGSREISRSAIRIVAYYAVPLAFVGALHLVYVRHLSIGGGPVLGFWEAATTFSALTLGFPSTPWFRAASLPLLASLVALGTAAIRRSGEPFWGFFPAILLAPFILVLLLEPALVYPRYFVILVPFLSLAVAAGLASLHVRPHSSRWLALGCASLVIVGNLASVVPLLFYGRANHRTALLEMAAATEGPVIEVGGDDELQNRLVLDFYSRLLPRSKTFRHVARADWNAERPEWLVLRSSNDPPLQVRIPGAGRFKRYVWYASAESFAWYAYRREPLPP